MNAKVEIYVQTQGLGAPGVRCGLMVVQFHSDGESFGGASRPNAEGFETVEATEEEEFA